MSATIQADREHARIETQATHLCDPQRRTQGEGGSPGKVTYGSVGVP